jgi:hypothetical protein
LADPDNTNDRATASVTVSGAGGGGGSADTCSGKVIINEVAWAGTAADPQSQWIELRNIGTEDVDLEGWVLRWRKKVPVTEEDYLWKEVRLSGVVAGASPSACELAVVDPVADIEFVKRDDVSWLVLAEPRDDEDSYFLLERKTDDTIRNVDADIVYDTLEPYALELSPEGDTMQLVDNRGSVVDTANAFESTEGRWPAGDPTTFATMERTDPLVADAETNWHTNLGIVTRGEDSNGRPLVATARVLNSQAVDAWTVYAETLTPSQTAPGTQYGVALDLTQADRLATGWPWIRVTRTPAGVGGGGAVADTSSYAFSSRTQDGLYWVDIDTTGMAPGEHLVWIVFGEGKAILVPIEILP